MIILLFNPPKSTKLIDKVHNLGDEVMSDTVLWKPAFGEIEATLKALREAGVTLEEFVNIRLDKKAAKKVAEILKELKNEALLLFVDMNKTIEQAIKEGGFDRGNSDINYKNFDTNEVGVFTVSAKLFHFNRPMESKEVKEEMDKDNYRPGKFRELLALGTQNPDLQRQHAVVALGSHFRDNNSRYRVPLLWSMGDDRVLMHDFSDCVWQQWDCIFLGVLNQK